MAGRKQHFIPQCLQRGFEAKRTGLKTQVYVYSKGRASFLSSTEGVAAERHFYSNPTDGNIDSLDDQITAFESEDLKLILEKLRSVTNGLVDSESAAIAVAHLTARTDHLRGTMTSLMNCLIAQLRTVFDDPAATRQLVGIDTKALEMPVGKMLEEELIRHGILDIPAKFRIALGRIVEFRIRERFDGLFQLAKGQLDGTLEALEARAIDTVASGHKKALCETLVSKERVRVMRSLTWQVISVEGEDVRFILPDCVAVACCGHGTTFEPLLMLSASDVATVVMPISSRQLLIGGPIQFEISAINGHFARSSFRFYISSRQDSETEALAVRIGESGVGFNVDLFPERLRPEILTPDGEFSGRLKVLCPSGVFGERARKAVMRIALEAMDAPALEAIDSIVIPSKFETMLEKILHRVPTSAEIAAASWGIAEPVKREGQWKCQVLLHRKMMEFLINDAPYADQRSAERLVRMTLGRACYIGCWARQFPSILEPSSLSPWPYYLQKVAFSAASAYFGALAARGVDAEPVIDVKGLQHIVTSIQVGLDGLQEIRRRFFEHTSVEQLVSEIEFPLDAILVSMANFFGFAAAAGKSPNEYAGPARVLANAGLWEWALLFDRDLARHYCLRYQWNSATELEPLAFHAERLLWTIGVLATPAGQDYRIDVYEDQGVEVMNGVLRM